MKFVPLSFIPTLKSHPLEIALCVFYSLLFAFMPNHTLMDWIYHLFLAPVYIACINVLHGSRFYKFSLILPISATLAVVFCKFSLLYVPADFALYIITLLVFIFAPFSGENSAFLRRASLRIKSLALALITTGALFLLASSLLASVDYLFGTSVFKENLIMRLFCIAAFGVFWPSFLLYERAVHIEIGAFGRALFAILSAALVLYTIVLYGYAVLIALDAQLPRRSLAVIVLPYLYLGVVAFCVRSIFSMAKFEPFYRYFTLLSIVPSFFLFAGIWRRVVDYAWTSERVYLLAVSILAALLALLCVFRRIKFRNLALIVLVAVFITGFIIDAQNIGKYSQLTRVDRVFGELNLIEANYTLKPDALDIKKKFTPAQIQKFDAALGALYYAKGGGLDVVGRYGALLDKLVSLHHYTDMEYYDFELKPATAADISFSKKAYFLSPAVYHDTSGPDVALYDKHGAILAKFDGQEHLERVFAEHGLNLDTRYKEEQLAKFHDDFLSFETPNGAIFMTRFRFTWDGEKRQNIFDVAENLFFLEVAKNANK